MPQPALRALAAARRVELRCAERVLNVHAVVLQRRCRHRGRRHHLVLVAVEVAVVVTVARVLVVVRVRAEVLGNVAAAPAAPPAVPAPETDLDVHAHAEELDVARETFPGDGALVEGFLDVGRRSEVHVMNEKAKGRRVRHRKVHCWMCRGRGQQAGKQRGYRKPARRRRLRHLVLRIWRNGQVEERAARGCLRRRRDEIDRGRPTKETPEERGVRREVVNMELHDHPWRRADVGLGDPLVVRGRILWRAHARERIRSRARRTRRVCGVAEDTIERNDDGTVRGLWLAPVVGSEVVQLVDDVLDRDVGKRGRGEGAGHEGVHCTAGRGAAGVRARRGAP